MINTMQKKLGEEKREKRIAEIKVIEEIKERRQRKWEGRPNYMESTWAGCFSATESMIQLTGRGSCSEAFPGSSYPSIPRCC
jgi:hypothetical protein